MHIHIDFHWPAGIMLLLGLLFIRCSSPSVSQQAQNQQVAKKPQRPLAADAGKIFMKGDQKLLFGGESEDWHFDISNCELKDEQFHYGIGRERFHALIEPAYISVPEADTRYQDSARFLLLRIGETVKAYGIDLLTHHEIVNDVVEGRPVAAAYCILADLGAVYDRKLDDGRIYTFALSGYTYFDPKVWDGMDGFVWWDRETESLWWPLTGNAVSGSMKGERLKILDEELWAQTTWGEIKSMYPEAAVLASDQTMDPPADWPRYESSASKSAGAGTTESVAPRWGENP